MNIAEFHEKRIAFAVLPNNVIVLTTNNRLGHKEWLSKEYNICDEVFEKLPRGYAEKGNIYFYIGSEFKELDNDILQKLIKNLDFLTINRNVYNGMVVGNIGEKWQGKTLIRSMK